jgi:hypothetical protein
VIEVEWEEVAKMAARWGYPPEAETTVLVELHRYSGSILAVSECLLPQLLDKVRVY